MKGKPPSWSGLPEGVSAKSADLSRSGLPRPPVSKSAIFAKASKMPPTISHVAQCTASCTRLSRECLQHLQPGSQFPWLLTNIALCVTFLKGLCQSTGDRNLLLYLLPTSCGRSPMRLAHAFRHDGSTRRGSPMALVRLRTLVQRFLH